MKHIRERAALHVRLRRFFAERPDVWKFAFFILVSPLSLQHLLRPACEVSGSSRGTPLSLPADHPFVKGYPCNATTTGRVWYIYRDVRVSYPLFYRIHRRDFWVPMSHFWLFVRLAASAALPPGLYLRAFAPVLNVCQRITPAIFLLWLSLARASEEPSSLGLWFLRVVPMLDVVSLRFHESGFILEALYGTISLVVLAWLGRRYATTRVELGLPLPLMLACRVASTAIILAVEARRGAARRCALALQAKLASLDGDGAGYSGMMAGAGGEKTTFDAVELPPPQQQKPEQQQEQRKQRQEHPEKQSAEAEPELKMSVPEEAPPAATSPLAVQAAGGDSVQSRRTYERYDGGSATANAVLRAPMIRLTEHQPQTHQRLQGQPCQPLQVPPRRGCTTAAVAALKSVGVGGVRVYQPHAQFVSTRIKIRGVDPADLAAGYEQRIAAVLAAQGMELEAVYVRRGCIEMVIDARVWARARARGSCEEDGHRAGFAESLSVGGELELEATAETGADYAANAATAACAGIVAPAAVGDNDSGMLQSEIPLHNVLPGRDLSPLLRRGSGAGCSDAGGSEADRGAMDVGPIIRALWLSCVDLHSESGPLSGTTSTPPLNHAPSTTETAAAAAAAASRGPTDSGTITAAVEPSAAVDVAAEESAQPAPPVECAARSTGARPQTAPRAELPPAIAALSPRAVLAAPPAGELCFTLHVLAVDDCPVEVLVRSQGRYLPAELTCCQALPVSTPPDLGRAGGPGPAASLALVYRLTLPASSLPLRPGLLVVEARRAGQVRSAAAPVLVVNDPWVAEELQAAAEGWQGPPLELQDILLDLAFFAHHAPAAMAAAAAAQQQGATTHPAAPEWRHAESELPAPLGPPPAEQPSPPPPLLRVRDLGLHMLRFFRDQGTWPLTVGWLQVSLQALGMDWATLYGGTASAAGAAAAATAVHDETPSPLIAQPLTTSAAAIGHSSREPLDEDPSSSACVAYGGSAAPALSLRRRRQLQPPPPQSPSPPTGPASAAAAPPATSAPEKAVTGAAHCGGGGWARPLRLALVQWAAPMDAEYQSFIAEFAAGTSHLSNLLILLCAASACLKPALRSLYDRQPHNQAPLHHLHNHRQHPHSLHPLGAWKFPVPSLLLSPPANTGATVLLQAAPVLLAGVPHMLTAAAWALLPRHRWIRCLQSLAVWKPLSAVAAELLMLAVPAARSPPHAAYHLGVAVWLGNGIVCPATAIIAPRTAVLIAVLRLPLDACLWLALGAPYGAAWAFARAAALACMYVTANGISHAFLRAEHGRRRPVLQQQKRGQ